MSSKVYMLLVCVLLGGCTSTSLSREDEKSFYTSQRNLFVSDYSLLDNENRRKVIKLFSLYEVALNSPKFLYASKLVEANGELSLFKLDESVNQSKSIILNFNNLSYYMNASVGSRYLHPNVTPTAELIRASLR
uniref:hypothetical protein n=1 Tax=Marinobacterium profundum TaxID=1714300 RepID=UPI000A955513|nr:hypothetical protein [Marinobacterium profundum]